MEPARQMDHRHGETQIPPAEESLLEWYFGPARALFERSTCGAMLDRMKLEGMVSRECTQCRGRGFLEDADISPAMRRCSPCEGPASHEPGRQKRACPWCWKGSGEVREGCWCRRCNGTGFMPIREKRSRAALTVRPKSHHGGGNGFEVDDTALRKFAKMSRRISELYEKDREALNILAAYYGQVGLRYGRTKRGRIMAVYALTLCGQRLVKRGQKFGFENGEALMAYQIIENEVEANGLKPLPQRTELINKADEQARVLLRKACAAWNATGVRVQA